MGIIALEEIQPGMILASDLRTSQGSVLLPKDSAVGAEHLRLARIWGIIAVGAISRLLGIHRRFPVRERLFVAGLLHDLGHLVIYKNYAEQAQALRCLATSSANPLTGLEREAWGFTHAELGSLLLQNWNIPQAIQDAAALHHSPLQASVAEEAKLVHLADVIAYSLGFGQPASALSLVVAQAENQLRDLMRIFLKD